MWMSKARRTYCLHTNDHRMFRLSSHPNICICHRPDYISNLFYYKHIVSYNSDHMNGSSRCLSILGPCNQVRIDIRPLRDDNHHCYSTRIDSGSYGRTNFGSDSRTHRLSSLLCIRIFPFVDHICHCSGTYIPTCILRRVYHPDIFPCTVSPWNRPHIGIRPKYDGIYHHSHIGTAQNNSNRNNVHRDIRIRIDRLRSL